jgi:hypothetical protein
MRFSYFRTYIWLCAIFESCTEFNPVAERS